MSHSLSFEKSFVELKRRISELKHYSREHSLDIEAELLRLESKVEYLQKNIYHHLSPWQKVQIARHPERPTMMDYVDRIFTDFMELHGDRLYGDDPSIVGGIAMFDGQPVTLIGHEKGKGTKGKIARNFGMPHPEGYRKALRLMKQANKFGRPILCFIDTPGAFPGIEAEERGQCEAIARNLKEMFSLSVPIITIVIGEGGSGGALAIGVGNKIMMLENAYYSVISPEGAAAILWRDAGKAEQAAEALNITAHQLHRLGLVDIVVPEPSGGAHHDIDLQAYFLKNAISNALRLFKYKSVEEIIRERYEKYNKIGIYASVLQSG
ncbi:acetyl-CoA carboxylase carboxyltransferase subunit alpha [Laceyella putida]|uniref:Acetyl-coenzyme A carboxylase carboxyl transferase subunit alpha n=1 Tax=Laceyella putida TaxID=110101 RepID=A0ABW2RHU2_9BACL